MLVETIVTGYDSIKKEWIMKAKQITLKESHCFMLQYYPTDVFYCGY